MVILDIGSSDLSSLNIITQVRSVFLGPIILLTSRNSELEQITAFNLGVDEYLVKPVSSNILNVRVDALFRRCSHQVLLDDKTEVQLGGLILYPSSYKCQIAGKPISLTQFEFKLLHLLVIIQLVPILMVIVILVIVMVVVMMFCYCIIMFVCFFFFATRKYTTNSSTMTGPTRRARP